MSTLTLQYFLLVLALATTVTKSTRPPIDPKHSLPKPIANGAPRPKRVHDMEHPYALPKGYSSGASSDSEYSPIEASPSSQESNREEVFAGWGDLDENLGQPRARITSHDITTDMRVELAAEGDLSKALIRIEVKKQG